MSEGNEKVVELCYLETPKGPVARFEGVKQLAELMVDMYNELDELRKTIEKVKTGEGVPENLENRLKTIEDQLTIMSDDMREVLNALGELSATVAQIKKALKL